MYCPGDGEVSSKSDKKKKKNGKKKTKKSFDIILLKIPELNLAFK